MPDKVDQLYDALKADGAVKNSRENFRGFMFAPGKQGYNNRLQLYKSLRADGAIKSKSYEEFRDKLGIGAVNPQRKQQASAAIGGTGNMTNWANPVDATDMRSEWEKQQKPKEQKPNIATETQKAVRGEGEGAKRLRAATQQLKDRADYQKETGKELKSQVDLTSVGVNPTLARDEQGAVMKDASGNPLIGYEADSTKANVQRQEDEKKRLKEQLEEAYAEREKLDAEIEEGRASAANRLLGGMLPGNQVKSGYNEADMEQSSLLSAKRLLDRRITALEAANNSSGFWGGTKDQLKDPTSWSFGLSDAEDALVMANLKKKLDDAGGDTSKLTEGERLLADNYLKNQEAQKLNEDRDWWYKAGQGFGQSLSFMKDFALSGGGFANIAKAGMRYGAKKGAQLASKTLGNYMTKNLGTKALGKTIETIGKGAGLVAGTEAGGLLLNNTVQAASSAADIINKNTGNLAYDKDGNLTFEGGQSLGKAILTSQLSRTGENASELFGLAFDAVPGILGKVIQKTTPGKVLKNIANNKVWKAGEKGLDYLGVQSVWGEGMEEEYGMLRTEILNTLTNGEYEPNGSGILDINRQLDTWANVGLTSMLLRVPAMIASGTNTANYYANKYNLNSSDKNMRDTFGNDERYNVVKTAIDEAENNQLAGVLSNLMTKSDLTDKEKQAMFTYANDLVKMRGFNIGNVVAAANGYTEPPRVSNYNIRGLHVDEVDKDGNVINSYDYDNADDLKAGLYEMQQNRADQTLQSDLMVMKARPNDQYQAFVDSYCEQFDVEPQELEEMLAKPSMERTEAEQSIVAPFADSLHNVVYDNSVLHEEQSQQDGEDLADVLSLDLSNINEEQALEAQKLTDEYKEAENALQELYNSGENGENIKDEIESMAGQPAQSIVSSLETFSPKAVDTVIGYYNAKAKLDGFVNRMSQKIDEEAANRRERHTFTGTINGQEDKTNIVNISDGTNTYTLVSGNVTTDGDGRITGSDTGLIIALDENGDFVQLSDTSGYGIVPSDMTLDQYQAQQEEELQLQMTNTMDPEGKLMEEQAEATAGGEDTGANGTEASPSVTALERIPKDEQGNPIYEQGTPEDTYDALTEQVGESAQILIKNQLDAAKKRHEKLVKDKEAGKLKGKTLQEQIAEIKELQDKIDAEDALVKFWTKVMTVPNNRRADEEVKAPVEETPQAGETVNETNEESAPDWSVDKASDARARGYRMENGYRVDRQQPITEKVEGNDTEVKFDKAEEPVKGKITVVEGGTLIPSHVNGQRNVIFFIDEAQPKERTDVDSEASSNRIAEKVNPEEITGGVTAYTGSPVVNSRGEVIQGNNRTIGMQKMWNNAAYEESQKKYKQYLIDHAAEFGLDPKQIEKMNAPVMVRMVDVSDDEAIRLGQKTAANTESGGKERIDPQRVIQQMGDNFRVFTNQLFSGEIEDQTLLSIIAENGVKVLKWLNDGTNHPKYITDTQFQSCFDNKGNLTEEAKTDLRRIVENMLFVDAPERLADMFYKMPAKAQNAILSTIWRDSQSEKNDRIIKDIQSSIEAFTVINGASEEFRGAKDVNTARAAVKDLQKQTQMFGDTETVLEKYSNFALELAIRYKGDKQNSIRAYFNNYYDAVQGKGGSLFESAAKKAKEQAIKDIFDIDINENENGTEGSNTVESDTGNGTEREPVSEGEPAVGEPVEEGEQPAVSGGGAETNEEVTEEPTAEVEQPAEESVEEQTKEEEPFELTLEALEASDLDESVKSGARAWLNGDKTQANQLAFLAAQDYVRNIHGDTERGGSDADSTQLGSEDNVSANREAGRGNGESGLVDSADNGEGVPEVGTGGTDSTGDVASSDGTRGDNGVSGEAPEQDAGSGGNGAVGSSGNRRKGRNGKSGRKAGGTTIPGGNAGRQTIASAREELDAALKEFEDALKESITEPLKGKLLAVDPISLYAFLGGAKAIKVLNAGTKVAYAAIKLGYYEFKDWVGLMKSKLGDPLRNIAGMSDEQIDGFVEMMWDYSLTIDGVTRKVSEWASVISSEALREQMGKTIEEKRELQKEAEKTPTIIGDITNIRESLPFLLTKQQEDVQKAERQFFDESHADARHGHGKGYMFTNGTGTGKTYTGLGIVKRFLKQGKGRVLIVTASETKISDWIKDAKNLGINASMLPDTSSKGEGVVVTQYANIRQNRKLLEDEFDLIVYDESHKIMENQDGSATSTSRAHHMLSNRDIRQAARRVLMAGDFGKEVEDAENELELLKQAVSLPTTEWTKEIKDAYNKAGGDMDSVENRMSKLKELTERMEETLENKVDELLSDTEQAAKLREAVAKTKVVFLSATPFNVPANLDYAEGYIFSYTNNDEVTKENDRLRQRDNFLVENFNSSHTRNAKTQVVSRIAQERIPDPQKASEEEVKFSDMLQSDLETMSGRDLDSEYDYSREFPKMDFEMADTFNDAIQSLSDGRFNVLRDYFDHLLDDYNTMTGYLEIFKAQMIAPRIREYIDLGKKVTLYHRRKASNTDMYPPFFLAMQKAERVAAEDEKLQDAIKAFRTAFKKLFAWEQSIDYMFPQDSILREFLTEKEKETYEKELKGWFAENKEKIEKLRVEVMLLNLTVGNLDGQKLNDTLAEIREKNKEIDKLMKKRPKPKSAVVSVFNGSETAKDRSEAIRKFNDDDSKTKVLVVQVQAGKEGISLHDTTGKYPRVQIGIFLPQSPIEFIQTEGRIFRVGNKSNAIFEYPLLGLDIELGNFAQKINGRSETTENLALGSRGRGLKDSISRAALASRKIDPNTATGIGGKELDSRQAQNADGFDEAMKNYSEWREEPKPDDINQIEVPDPIGYIMTKMSRAENGERALVPNARRGSIARYMPSSTRLTAMEERNKDYARLSALIGGSGRKILNEPFVDHNRVNKYDLVVLNTSHGENGKKDLYGNSTSLDTRDVLKACNHTDPSGRVVALVDSDKVGEIKEAIKKSTSCAPVMEVKLPSFVLGKPSSILILDNIEDRDKRNAVKAQELDLSQAKDEDNLFAQLRDMVVPERNIDKMGRVERKLRTVITPFVNTGCMAKSKNYSTGKMESDVSCRFGSLYAHFARGKMAWMKANGRVFNAFVLRYNRIVDNDIDYIQEIANDWVKINDQLELDDEVLYSVYQYYIGYKRDRLGSVRDCLRIMAQSIELALGKTPMQIRNIAEGKVENEVSGVYDLKGFREVFDSLNNNNAELEALADKVFEAVDHIDGLKFQVIPGAAFRNGGGHNVVAHYVPSRNIIELNGDLFNSVRIKDSFKAQTVVHEMIHALTSWAIETYNNEATRGQLSQEQQEACKTIKDVFAQINNDEFRRQLRLESEIEDNAEYGLTDEHEMMAELSNPIFRKVLKAKKLWKQLINGIKMLLGIQVPGTEAEETDALTALDEALETLMNTYDPNLYSSFIRNSEAVRNMEIMNPSDPMQAINDAADSWRKGNQRIDTANPLEAINRAADSWRRSVKESESSLSSTQQLDDSKNKSVPLERRTTKSYTDKDGNYHRGIEEEISDLEADISRTGTADAQTGKEDARSETSTISNRRLEERLKQLRAEVDRRERKKRDIKNEYNIDDKGNVSIGDLSRLFHDLNSNKAIGKLFEKVYSALMELGVDFRFSTNLDALTGGESYAFHNVTFYNWDILLRDISDQRKAVIILHEMIHNLTSHILERYDDPSLGELSEKQKDIAKELLSIYNALKEAQPKDKDGKEPYGMNSAHEMIAELANPAFRKILSKIPYRNTNESILQKIKNAIRKLLGIGNALGALGDTLDKILETYDTNGIEEYREQRAELEQELRDSGSNVDFVDFVDAVNHNTGRKIQEDDPLEAIRIAANRFRRERNMEPDENPAAHSAKAVYEDRLNRVETVFSEAYQDSMISLKVGQNAIAKDKDIPDSQNAYMAENLMHGKNKNEQDLFNIRFRDPLINTINKIMGLTGMNWGDVDRYVYTKSGLERNREFYVRDWLEKNKDKDGVNDIRDKWLALKEKAEDIDDNYTFADYLDELTDFIKKNINAKYDPSKHDYSGFRAMFGEDYDESEIIDDLMNTETEIGDDVNTLWEQINACTKYGLDRYKEAGLKSEEQIENVKKMFHWYVPMRGFKEDTGEDMYQYFTGKGRTKNYVGGLLKHAKGRGSEASYPISTIFAMTYKAIADCNQNLVNQKFYRLCQANKNDLVVLSDSWVKLNENTGEWEEVWPQITDDMSEEEIRQATIDFEKEMNGLADVDKAKKIKGKPNFAYKPIDKDKKNEHVVEVWMNGQKKLATVVGNPRMAQALNGQLRFERSHNVFSQLNAYIKNFMSSLATSYNPTFALRNMDRDWTHFAMMLNTREGAGYAGAALNYYRETLPRPYHGKKRKGADQGTRKIGMVELFKKYREGTLDMNKEMERDFKDFMDNGGITGFVQMNKIDDIQKEMEKLHKQMKDGKVIKLNNKLWDISLGAVEAFNEAIENNARFATYRASRHYANRTKARSAYDAKEITVNFNRKGAGSKTAGFKGSSRVEHAAQLAGITSQILGEGRMFFNATVQAIATTFKNFQNPDGSLNKPYIAKWAARYAAPPFLFGLALPFINQMLAGALGGDDDDDPYANLPEWTRRKNLCIYAGNWDGHDYFITIPVGQELAAFLSLGDMFAGYTYAPNLKPVDRSFTEDMTGIMNTFSPIDVDTKITKGGITRNTVSEITGRTFSVLAPLIAVEQNLSWTGREIYREDLYQNDYLKPEYQMVYSGTNPVLVGASKILHELGGGDDITRGKMEVNPAIVQYLWEQYTGGPGKVFSNTISIGKDAKDILQGKESDFNIRKVEGLKAFVQQGDDRTEYYRVKAKYRKYKEDADKLYNDIKGYKSLASEDPAAKMKLDRLMKGEEYVRMKIAREAEKHLAKIRKSADALEGAEKKKRMKEYNKLVKEVVDRLDDVQ